ncbi:hypothetical protein G7Z17_g13651 [Cylindrodendrum hubeiense]|uniref:Uncharacterized protein n=1 Tax=Cylindrodendrum hubeiense TaxID=595255 RepID=A0A9P5GRX0_9HYPO|nr:hypothetical protein G7Z17_g13651 [Cylindrodendrum hubeiense]
MRRAISVTLGSVALLATAAIIGVLVVISIHISQPSGRASSQVSIGVEAVVLVCLGWLMATYTSPSVRYWSRRCLGVDQGICLLVVTFATVAAVATLIQLSKAPVDHHDNILGANKNNFLMGSSVALGLSFAFQSIFLLFHFILSRSSDQAQSLHSMEERKPPATRVKTIRYSQTPDPELASRLNSMCSQQTPASSIGGRSRSGTMTSIKSSLSHAIRPVTSKTQLLPTRELRRPASMDSYAHRTSGEDAFDSWDTSSVDTQNRQAVLEVSTPPQVQGRFLETIPGSPTVSRTPSPNTEVMPFEPPRIRPRSRSYSPAPRRREREQSSPIPEPPPSMSELHIHPLFRSDSPDPPPVTTPGTVVIASPNAGQVITHRQSVRSLNQTRVSSNPLFSSPLSTRDSTVRDEQSSISITEEESDTETEPTPTPSERSMTPPIPEWVMGAGTRSSWTGYNSRKVKTESNGSMEEEQQQQMN